MPPEFGYKSPKPILYIATVQALAIVFEVPMTAYAVWRWDKEFRAWVIEESYGDCSEIPMPEVCGNGNEVSMKWI